MREALAEGNPPFRGVLNKDTPIWRTLQARVWQEGEEAQDPTDVGLGLRGFADLLRGRLEAAGEQVRHFGVELFPRDGISGETGESRVMVVGN